MIRRVWVRHEVVEGVRIVTGEFEVDDASELRVLGDAVRERFSGCVAVLAGRVRA